MCTFILSTIPRQTDLTKLTRSIPNDLKRSLLRSGLNDDTLSAKRFGFTPIPNGFVEQQLPNDDVICWMTNLHCDCWSTLGTPNISSTEAANWRSIFLAMLAEIDRFGLIIHFGDTSDHFPLLKQETRSLYEPEPLVHLERDTYYEICLSET